MDDKAICSKRKKRGSDMKRMVVANNSLDRSFKETEGKEAYTFFFLFFKDYFHLFFSVFLFLQSTQKKCARNLVLDDRSEETSSISVGHSSIVIFIIVGFSIRRQLLQ